MYPPLMKPLLLLFIFLFISLHAFSAEATARSFNPPTSLQFQHTAEVKVDTKKAMGRTVSDAVWLDYEPPGANPAHEPPKKGGPRASNTSP